MRRILWVALLVSGCSQTVGTGEATAPEVSYVGRLDAQTLVALESRPQGLAGALHEGIGLVALAAVCTAVIALMKRSSHAAVV